MPSRIPAGLLIRMVLLWGLCGLYFLSPIDLIPDFLPYVGRLDDLVVILAVYRLVRRLRVHSTVPPHGERTRHQARSSSTLEEEQNEEPAHSPRSPWDILRVTPQATSEEIHTAYKALLMQYHPDRVAHLGEEFQQLAHRRTLEIQHAYSLLKPR